MAGGSGAADMDDVDDDDDNGGDGESVLGWVFLSLIPMDSEKSFCGDSECFCEYCCSLCWICSFWLEIC